MNLVRLFLFCAVFAVGSTGLAVAQDDPAREYFSAYQEFQRAERLEREGRNDDAIAKFRFVATQLSQIKSQSPDWQPIVIDFRLGKTKEAIVRLEGSLESPTLGPPPDLPMLDGPEDILPPLESPRRPGGSAPPTISISPGDEGSTGSSASPPSVAAASEESDDVVRLREQLRIERGRTADLEKSLQQGEADLSAAGMELEKTKVLVVDLTTKLRQVEESGAASAEISASAKEEIDKLSAAVRDLEAAVTAANSEKDELSGRIAESAKQVEDLAARAEQAEARSKELEVERDTLAASRDQAVKDAETAKAETQTLTVRVTELEEERMQLVAARDEARKEAAEAKTALEKSADLIEANRQLEGKLAEAAMQVEGMASDAKEKEQVIAGLQSSLDSVREELADAQSKLRDDRERFDKLQLVNDQLLKEYDEVSGALAAVQLGDVTAVEAKLIQQENEVLRGIIMRQIKEQARREQAYRLAQEEMDRLEIKSDTLNDKIIQLAKPTLELSKAEQEMLKSPVVTVLHASDDTITAQVEIFKPKVEDLAAAPGEEGPEDVPQIAAEVVAEDAPQVEVEVVAEAGATPVAGVESEAVAADTLPAETAGDAEEEALPSASPDEAVASPPEADIPPEVLALIAEARDQFVRGNFSAAEKLYQQFVELQPNSVVALANLGVTQFRQGKLTAAQLALEKAIAADPNDAFTLTTLGAVMIEQNRIEDSLAYLERASEVVPDDPVTLNYLGVAASQLGQFGKAEQSLRRAITVNPEYAEAHFNLAVIYATAKPPSIALAKRHYEKALELGSGPDARLDSLLRDNPGS
jgi:tetratricopeptide (TPR) repeat protein/ABC-type transporter Mla subunit MlaD